MQGAVQGMCQTRLFGGHARLCRRPSPCLLKLTNCCNRNSGVTSAVVARAQHSTSLPMNSRLSASLLTNIGAAAICRCKHINEFWFASIHAVITQGSSLAAAAIRAYCSSLLAANTRQQLYYHKRTDTHSAQKAAKYSTRACARAQASHTEAQRSLP
jgi:hypothetical protein